MNTSPVKTWAEFNSSDTAAIYTYANEPRVIMLFCALVAVSVACFFVQGYRLKHMRSK